MDDLDTRRARAARNQSLFREVNERIVALSHRFSDEERPNSYICECLNTDCSATIVLTYEEYEELRGRANRFFVRPGHEDPAVETVVDVRPGYVVVEKVGAGSEIAESSDTRKAGSEPEATPQRTLR